VFGWTKRLLVGRPLRSDRLGEQLLPKRIALPIFASDPLSSVAYATQEILVVLTLGGLAYLGPRVEAQAAERAADSQLSAVREADVDRPGRWLLARQRDSCSSIGPRNPIHV